MNGSQFYVSSVRNMGMVKKFVGQRKTQKRTSYADPRSRTKGNDTHGERW